MSVLAELAWAAAPGVPIYAPSGVAAAAEGYDISDVQKMFTKLA